MKEVPWYIQHTYDASMWYIDVTVEAFDVPATAVHMEQTESHFIEQWGMEFRYG